MTEKPAVLFLCVHNAGRSQMALGWFQHLAGDRAVGWSGGSEPGDEVNPSAVDRCVYAGVVEDSVYVAEPVRGRGVGRRLLAALVGSTEAAGIWTIQTGIFPENESSLALHRAAGFRVLGVRERPRQLRGRWRDVVLLERRSTVAGR